MDVIQYMLSKKAIAESISHLGDVFTVKGNKSSFDELPMSGNKNGDIYLVGPNENGSFNKYYWSGNEQWETMGITSSNTTEEINEITLYVGPNGIGTIENPAEGTILYKIKEDNASKYVTQEELNEWKEDHDLVIF